MNLGIREGTPDLLACGGAESSRGGVVKNMTSSVSVNCAFLEKNRA
jgi:hypothetical protein